MKEALTLAHQADVLVVVAGIEEGEFNDRAYLSLPGNQEELIVKLSQTGKPVVVLLVGGSAITMANWIDKVASVVQVWYPGEAGGLAVADMLFGKSNPSGKLPITFPVFEGQLPLVYNHKPTGRGDDYTDLTGQPQFPFGYGLSYTQFAYADLRLAKKTMGTTETTTLSCTVTNTGKVYGEEVVQLYIRDLLSSVARPITELKGFKRIGLKPGETKQIDFEISPLLLQMLDKNLQKVVEPGDFRLMLGSSSKDIRLSTTITVK
jgi:beta-glucosidase